MIEKLIEIIQNCHRNLSTGFIILFSVLAVSTIGIIAVMLAYSHYTYKSAQKKLFVEKWDSIAARLFDEG